jgi:hypothetical protein
MKTAITTSTKTRLSSFDISCLTVKNVRRHTTGEKFPILAGIRLCEIVHCRQTFKPVPLSNNVVMRRIELMPEDIKEQTITRIKCNPKFAVQLDESTGVASLLQLLEFVRYY